MAKISIDLQNLVKSNKNIKKVYFDAEGNHYFTKHEIEFHEVDDEGFSKGVKKVNALPGSKKNIVKIYDKSKKSSKSHYVNTDYTPVAEEMTREEILKATAQSLGMTEEKKLEILKQAAEISKQDGFKDLLDKINPKDKKIKE